MSSCLEKSDGLHMFHHTGHGVNDNRKQGTAKLVASA
jgi:hypothetical protein